MTQRRALGDLDFDSAFDDPDNGWFGHVQADDPMSLRRPANVADLPREDDQPDVGEIGTEDTDSWPVLTVDATPPPDVEYVPRSDVPDDRPSNQPEATTWTGVATSRHGRVGVPDTASWESRLSHSAAWDFKVSDSRPGMRSKFAVAAFVVAGLAVAGVLLLRSPGPAVESTVVSPSESTAQPAPTSDAPALSTASDAPAPPVLPAPPPLPPPSAEEISPPVVTRDYPQRRQSAPQESTKPEIDVTRTPTTRSQMSATPPPPPRVPERDSSTPGDSGRRGGFGFGF